MTNISYDNIVDCVISGIKRSTRDYLSLTKEFDELNNGPEYFLTVGIANELKRKLEAVSIFLEEPWGDVQDPPEGRKLVRWNSSNRYDIVVRNSMGYPYAAIEVKHRVNGIRKEIITDFERISTAVEMENGQKIFNMGIFAFYTVEYTTKAEITNVKDKIINLYSNLERELNKHKRKAKLDRRLISPNPYTNEDGKLKIWIGGTKIVWGGGCFILSPE